MGAQLVRIAPFDTADITVFLDGEALPARLGESVLAAVLTHAGHLRQHGLNGEKRAGFCLMGACQDCFVWLEPTSRVRACSTLAEDGMRILTRPPPDWPFA